MKKNEATLFYKEERFLVWQDDKSCWYFTYANLQNVNTGHRELQLALNIIYESIDDKLFRFKKKKPEGQKKLNLSDL